MSGNPKLVKITVKNAHVSKKMTNNFILINSNEIRNVHVYSQVDVAHTVIFVFVYHTSALDMLLA